MSNGSKESPNLLRPWRCMVFGQRPRRGRSPVEHRGTFVCPSVHPSPLGSLRPEICPLRPEICSLRLQISPLSPQIWLLRPHISLQNSNLLSQASNLPFQILNQPYQPSQAFYLPSKAISGLIAAISSFKAALSGRMNESPPVFYRTSSPSGPLPCFLSPQFTIMQSRATGIADHILPLGDLFLFGQRPRRGQ